MFLERIFQLACFLFGEWRAQIFISSWKITVFRHCYPFICSCFNFNFIHILTAQHFLNLILSKTRCCCFKKMTPCVCVHSKNSTFDVEDSFQIWRNVRLARILTSATRPRLEIIPRSFFIIIQDFQENMLKIVLPWACRSAKNQTALLLKPIDSRSKSRCG